MACSGDLACLTLEACLPGEVCGSAAVAVCLGLVVESAVFDPSQLVYIASAASLHIIH